MCAHMSLQIKLAKYVTNVVYSFKISNDVDD